MSLCFLAVMALFAVSGWIRPPISTDIGGLCIPLLSGDSSSPTELVYGPRKLVPLSIGTLLLGTIAVGVILVMWKASWFRISSGLLLCAVMVCGASVALNHPELVEELDRQNEQAKSLVTVLESTVKPPIAITYHSRVPNTSPTEAFGLLPDMFVYLPGRLTLVGLLALTAVALAHRGRLRRRLSWVALWSFAGLIFAAVVVEDRLRAERWWSQAVEAERRGEFDTADRYAQAAVDRFPSFGRLRRVWEFRGRVDYRLDRDTSAARFFLAIQRGRNGEERRAIAELEALLKMSSGLEPVRVQAHGSLWLADALFQRAVRLFVQGNLAGARQHWERALEVDPSQVYLGLHIAALCAPVERRDPESIAALIHPLLKSMADRPLRAAFEAMLGDCYFQCRRYADARACYERSLKAYSLPKQINYRAIRGLLGM